MFPHIFSRSVGAVREPPLVTLTPSAITGVAWASCPWNHGRDARATFLLLEILSRVSQVRVPTERGPSEPRPTRRSALPRGESPPTLLSYTGELGSRRTESRMVGQTFLSVSGAAGNPWGCPPYNRRARPTNAAWWVVPPRSTWLQQMSSFSMTYRVNCALVFMFIFFRTRDRYVLTVLTFRDNSLAISVTVFPWPIIHITWYSRSESVS